MEINWWYLIAMIGPLGLMGLVRASISSYNDWKASKQPILQIAPQELVLHYAPMLEIIIPTIFDFGFDDCVLTDESSLEDFAPEYPVTLSLEILTEEFGLDVEKLPDHRLVSICAALEEPASN